MSGRGRSPLTSDTGERCCGAGPVERTLAPEQVMTVQTGWSSPCSQVTFGTTNGWDTNFDNLNIQ